MKPQNLHAHEDRLLDFAYGELPAPEAQVVESHLQGCARCTQALDDIRGVRVTMSQLSEESAPDAGLESLLAYAQQSARRAAAGPAPTPSRWRRWLLPVVGLASVGTLGILTLNARSPELTRPNLAAAETQSSKAAPAMVPAPKPVAPASAAPAQAAAAEAAPPPADTLGEDSNPLAMDARKPRGEESRRAEGWEMAGSGGGLGSRNRSDELKAKRKSAEAIGGMPSVSKTAPTEKMAQREVSNLDEEAVAEGAPVVVPPPAPASPPQEPLRLGGALAKKESAKDKDDDAPSKGGAWDEGPGAPALEAVTEPLAQGAVASAPAPSVSYAERGGVVAPSGGASDGFAQAPTSRAKASKMPAKAPARAQQAQPEPAAVRPAEAELEDAALSPGELSRQAQAANRTGDRDREARLLRLALDAGASGTERLGLLNRLCDAELALGRRREGVAACNQVLTEAPGSSAAQAARRRLSRESVSSESPAVDSQPAP